MNKLLIVGLLLLSACDNSTCELAPLNVYWETYTTGPKVAQGTSYCKVNGVTTTTKVLMEKEYWVIKMDNGCFIIKD
jgi:hypothetical protein